MKERLFIDCQSVHVKAGRGGEGSPSFRREAHVEFGGPDGGDGGRGGNVILRGSRHVDTLLGIFYSPRLFAENGEPGRGQKMFGRNGTDLVVDVPCGTTVIDEETDEVCFDVVDDGQEVVIARGGRGGLGNVHWKSSTNQAPTQFTPGEEGEEARATAVLDPGLFSGRALHCLRFRIRAKGAGIAKPRVPYHGLKFMLRIGDSGWNSAPNRIGDWGEEEKRKIIEERGEIKGEKLIREIEARQEKALEIAGTVENVRENQPHEESRQNCAGHAGGGESADDGGRTDVCRQNCGLLPEEQEEDPGGEKDHGQTDDDCRCHASVPSGLPK